MSRVPVQEPTLVEEKSRAHDGKRWTHPAFAVIGASRVNGSTNLFDSSVKHSGFIRLHIRRAELQESSGCGRWIFGGQRLIEVEMSEAQWVALISRMNMGEGVPCTLNTVMGEQMPLLPKSANPAEVLHDHAAAAVESVRERQAEAVKSIRDLVGDRLPAKVMAELEKSLDRLTRDADTSAEFYRKRLNEEAERLVNEAKIELDATLSAATSRFGVATINQLAQIMSANPEQAIKLLALEHKEAEQ